MTNTSVAVPEGTTTGPEFLDFGGNWTTRGPVEGPGLITCAVADTGRVKVPLQDGEELLSCGGKDISEGQPDDGGQREGGVLQDCG